MNKSEYVDKIIERIKVHEDEHFNYNLPAILGAYQNIADNQSSLSIKILSIFGGFIATLFFLGCLAISGLFDSEIALSIFGIVCIIVAIAINKYDQLIIDTLSLSLFISGFAMFVFGLSEVGFEEETIACITILLSLVTLFFTQNYMLSFVAILNIGISFLVFINLTAFHDFIHFYIVGNAVLLSYIMINEAKFLTINPKISKLYDPVRIGLVFTLLFGLAAIGKRHLIPVSQNYIWCSSIVLMAAILFVVHKIKPLITSESTGNSWLILGCTLLLLLPSIFAPSILGTILIILLSYFVRFRTGFAIGIIAFIYFIIQYYYDLNFTLLTKSVLLFSSGILLLLFYFRISKTLVSNE